MFMMKFTPTEAFDDEPAVSPVDFNVSVAAPSSTILGRRTLTKRFDPSEFPSASLNYYRFSRTKTKSASSPYETAIGFVKYNLKFSFYPSASSISQTRPRSSASASGIPSIYTNSTDSSILPANFASI